MIDTTFTDDEAKELLRLWEALERVKTLVCGDEVPRWSKPDARTATRVLIADICDAALAAPKAPIAEGWRPIKTLPAGLVIAGTADGRIMIWRGEMLARNMDGPTPGHLQFPAIAWMPLPAPPTTGETDA